MITIICGEDTVSSRNYFFDLKKKYQEKGKEIENISGEELNDLLSWLGQSQTLFGLSKVFFIQNMFKKIVKRNKKMLEKVIKILKSSEIDLIDWEDGLSTRGLKTILKLEFNQFRKSIKEFKPSKNIFKLLDACHPSNKQTFIKLLKSVSKKTDDYFIFIMLSRHIRNLILAKENGLSNNLQIWQKKKLQNQADYWKIYNLISFYQSLHRIDLKIKTSTSPLSTKKLLDIMACYYLS